MSALFKKNHFSTSKPEFSKLGSGEAEPVLRVMRRHYPRLRIRAVWQVRAFGINSQNWKVDCGKAAYVLKRVPASSARTLKAQAAWSERLYRAGFPAARFYLTAAKTRVASEGQHAYCLSMFVPGDYMGASVARWKDLLRHQRRLISYCAGNMPRGAGKVYGCRDFFTAAEDRTIRGLDRKKWKYVREKYKELRAIYKKQARPLRRALFHVDMHPLNALFRGGRLRLLADFDSFRETTLEISQGFSAFKCSREVLVSASGPFDRNLESLSAVYRRYLGGSFAAALRYGQMDVLKRLLYILGELSDGGASKWKFMLDTQLTGMKEIDAMLCSLENT